MEFISWIILAMSGAAFICGLVLFFASPRSRRITRRLLLLTMWVILAVLLLEIYKGIRAKSFPFSMLIDTMQVFSLDASYDIETPTLNEEWLTTAVTIYKAVLYSVAPVVGGAVIYDVLAGFSPDISMWFSKRKRLYIFSEINEKAVTLAESIVKEESASQEKKSSYAIVFTDAYLSNLEESESELLMRARDLRAICLQDDILHCSCFGKARYCSFFLMDENPDGSFSDIDNISTFRGLVSYGRENWIRKCIIPALRKTDKGCRIFFFTEDPQTVRNIRAVKNDYISEAVAAAKSKGLLREDTAENAAEETEEKKKTKEDEFRENEGKKLSVHVVRDYGQCSCALMKELPLFKAICAEPAEKKTAMRVLILGNNDFSFEMFKTVFWCGQMLDHPLEIAVAYKPEDGRGGFMQKLDRLSPEIIESCTVNNGCLLIRSDDYSEPYAALTFIEEDVSNVDMEAFLNDERCCTEGSAKKIRLAEYDYFIVANGGDSDNIAIADTLQRNLTYLRRSSFNNQSSSLRKTPPKRRSIIAVAVENNDLSEITGARYRKYNDEFSSPENGWFYPEVVPFGSLEKRYDWNNVSANGKYLAAEDGEPDDGDLRHSLPGSEETKDNIYDEWSEIARSFHLQYKMFSVGCRTFPGKMDNIIECAVWDKVKYCNELKKGKEFFDLTWLEHRRWNAFLRTQGFRCPPGMQDKINTALNSPAELANEASEKLKFFAYKNIDARLQPCLVECGKTAAESKDMLDGLIEIRRLVDSVDPKKNKGHKKNKDNEKNERWLYKGENRPKGVKEFDAPDLKNCPTFSRAEAYHYLMENTYLSEDRKKAAIEWKRLMKVYPELKQYEAAEIPGRYYVDMVMGRWQRHKMRVIKKCDTPAVCFRLGENSELEKKLTADKKLKQRDDGSYEVVSRETLPEGPGEKAAAGDAVKLDSGSFPYPVKWENFLRNHECRNGQWYQIPQVREAWCADRPKDKTVQDLLNSKKLVIDPTNDERYFSAFLHDTWLYAKKDTVVVFYETEFDLDGNLLRADFNFVAREEFDRSYTVLSDE